MRPPTFHSFLKIYLFFHVRRERQKDRQIFLPAGLFPRCPQQAGLVWDQSWEPGTQPWFAMCVARTQSLELWLLPRVYISKKLEPEPGAKPRCSSTGHRHLHCHLTCLAKCPPLYIFWGKKKCLLRRYKERGNNVYFNVSRSPLHPIPQKCQKRQAEQAPLHIHAQGSIALGPAPMDSVNCRSKPLKKVRHSEYIKTIFFFILP